MVAEDQLSLAIGKRGQNARLTSKLTGWQIDIEPETVVTVGFEEKVAQAVQRFAAIPGLTPEVASVLVHAGFSTVDALLQAELADLEQIEQIKDQAPAIMAGDQGRGGPAQRRRGGREAGRTLTR